MLLDLLVFLLYSHNFWHSNINNHTLLSLLNHQQYVRLSGFLAFNYIIDVDIEIPEQFCLFVSRQLVLLVVGTNGC